MNSQTPPPQSKTRGITLIEMLIVIILIGLLAGITASKLDWTRYRADSAARGLLSDLSQAQRTAVSLQMDVRVTVVNTDRIRIHEDANNNAALDSGERVIFSVLSNGFKIGKGSMSSLPSPAEPSELTSVVFRRDGSASRSGSIYLSSSRADSTCVWCRAVAVTRVTGRAESYSFATGQWARH